MTDRDAQILRMKEAIRKLAMWQGYDVQDLVDDGYLEPEDIE